MLSRLVLLALLALPTLASAQQESTAQLLDRGIARMGGDSLLRSIRSVRLDVLTVWFRTTFAQAPFSDAPSLERNVELRDYDTRAWRNTRFFPPTAPTPGVIVVVRDTIAMRGNPTAQGGPFTWGPLNVAYVEERRELFGFAPERILLTLRDQSRVRALPDTTLDGEIHARLATTIDGWPTEVFIRRSDALPRLVRFRADETNDFGLAPWAEHEVEFWYSNWGLFAPGVLLPRQRDVQRVGKPYKRMTLMQAMINAPVPADSFAISDSIATAYLATEHRPMWRTPLEGQARIERDHFASFPPLIGTAGAVRIGGQWVVLESAQAVGAVELVAEWLQRHGGGAPIGAAIAANVWTGNGGTPWFVRRQLPVYVAPGAVATLRTVNHGMQGLSVVQRAQWIRVGSDSLWLEPVSAPDFAGTMAIYSPTHRWLWLPVVGSRTHQVEVDAVIRRLEARGLRVELLGGIRALVSPRP
jgi:hypothetical protein